MVGNLLSDVEPLRVVRVIVPTAEELAEDGVVGFLNTFGLDVPAGEVVLEDTDEALFGVIAFLGSTIAEWVVILYGQSGHCVPENEIWMRHEVCDTFEHRTRLEYEGREGHFGQIHTHPM